MPIPSVVAHESVNPWPTPGVPIASTVPTTDTVSGQESPIRVDELIEEINRALGYDVSDVGSSTEPRADASQVLEQALEAILGYSVKIRTDEELLHGLRGLMADDENELGTIPDDVRREVEQQWRD